MSSSATVKVKLDQEVCADAEKLIGLHGIVLHESKSTFQMITKRNRLIVIAKEDAVFQFVVDGKLFTLFGNAMRQRTHLRGRKAKVPTTIPFLLN
uniref:Ribonuclease P protein subunit p29 n=1 Tax=Globodera pallida TaxID=36090 RepID=A0A183BST4_GLOPA